MSKWQLRECSGIFLFIEIWVESVSIWFSNFQIKQKQACFGHNCFFESLIILLAFFFNVSSISTETNSIIMKKTDKILIQLICLTKSIKNNGRGVLVNVLSCYGSIPENNKKDVN